MAVISSVTYALLGLYFTLPITSGHGMMIEPAMRSSLWRFDYPDAIPNYNDNGLNCGGFTVRLSMRCAQWASFLLPPFLLFREVTSTECMFQYFYLPV